MEAKMAGGGWGCPHEVSGACSKVNNLPCDPGMKGCELYGRYKFFDASKNQRLEQKQARAALLVPETERDCDPTRAMNNSRKAERGC
jgi:hypothetical protein